MTNSDKAPVKWTSRSLKRKSKAQSTFTTNSTTSTKIIEDMSSQETTNSLTESTRKSLSLITATQSSRLKTSGWIKRRAWITMTLPMISRLFPVDLLPRVSSMILSSSGSEEPTVSRTQRSTSTQTTSPGPATSPTSLKTLTQFLQIEVSPGEMCSGTTWPTNTSSSGWELLVSQTSVNCGVESIKIWAQDHTTWRLKTTTR